ncbi:MAG: hypothetical protein AB3N28_09515 [Kordiimonas sp.]
MNLDFITSSFTYDPVTGSLRRINGLDVKTKHTTRLKVLARDGRWYNHDQVIYGLLSGHPLRKGIAFCSADGSFRLSSMYLHDTRKAPQYASVDHLSEYDRKEALRAHVVAIGKGQEGFQFMHHDLTLIHDEDNSRILVKNHDGYSFIKSYYFEKQLLHKAWLQGLILGCEELVQLIDGARNHIDSFSESF